jgi:hypothetical protein
MKDFVPIGVWVCNWADIFPWLAAGYCHAIDDTTAAETIVKFRMMAQDFLTLSRLYRYAAAVKLLIPEEPAFDQSEFDKQAAKIPGRVIHQWVNSFASAYGSLADARPATPAEYKSAAAAAHNLLGRQEKKIYKIWDQTPCLRGAELGLGLVNGAGQSLTTHTKIAVGNDWLAGHVPESEISCFMLGKCEFSGLNFSSFADFYKVLPLILPSSGKIIAFCEWGFLAQPNYEGFSGLAGFLAPGFGVGPRQKPLSGMSFREGNVFCFKSGGPRQLKCDRFRGTVTTSIHAKQNAIPLEFKPAGNGEYLDSVKMDAVKVQVKLYPIPLSAALHVNSWMGQSFSSNVKADAELNQRLEKIVGDLRDSKVVWSWSSDKLPDDWSAKAPYDPATLRTEYFGFAINPDP